MKHALFIIVLLLVGCSKDSPVEPPPPLSMTGRWDVTLTAQTTLTVLLDLSEDNGSLSGSMKIVDASLSVGGTVTKALEVSLGGSDPSARMLITANTNATKDQMNGYLQLWDRSTFPETYLGYYNLTAKKR